MSLASHTSTLFHPSFNLLHMSLIKPHLHIHTTTHIPQQPSKPKHHITHLILQLFPASSLTHLDHFIPDLFQSETQITLVIPQASTILHSSTSFFNASSLTHGIPFQFHDFTVAAKKEGLPCLSCFSCFAVLISGGGSSSTVSRVGLFRGSSGSLALLRRSPCFRTGRFSSSGLPPLGSVLGLVGAGVGVLRAAFSGRSLGMKGLVSS